MNNNVWHAHANLGSVPPYHAANGTTQPHNSFHLDKAGFVKAVRALVSRTHIDADLIHPYLPHEIKTAIPSGFFRAMEKNMKGSGMFDLDHVFGALKTVYDRLPSWDFPAEDDDVNLDYLLQDKFWFPMSAVVARQQIAAEVAEKRVSNWVIYEALQKKGFPLKSAMALLEDENRVSVPRQMVASALEIVRTYEPPQPVKVVNPDSHLDVSVIRPQLVAMFQRADLKVYDVYRRMPSEVKATTSFWQVAGWFDGEEQEFISKEDLGAFLNTTLAILEEKISAPDQTSRSDYPPELPPTLSHH